MSKKTLLWLIGIVAAIAAIAGYLYYENYTYGQKIVTDYFVIKVMPNSENRVLNLGMPIRFGSPEEAYKSLRVKCAEHKSSMISRVSEKFANEDNPVIVAVCKKLVEDYSNMGFVVVSCTHKRWLDPTVIRKWLDEEGLEDYDKMKEFCIENQVFVECETLNI